jgi:hypothetical protein
MPPAVVYLMPRAVKASIRPHHTKLLSILETAVCWGTTPSVALLPRSWPAPVPELPLEISLSKARDAHGLRESDTLVGYARGSVQEQDVTRRPGGANAGGRFFLAFKGMQEGCSRGVASVRRENGCPLPQPPSELTTPSRSAPRAESS